MKPTSDLTVGKWRMKELYHRYYLFITDMYIPL